MIMPKIAENRKERRYPSIAHARIPELFTGDALLRDISITGCRIECTMHIDIKENARYTITVLPEKSAGVDQFDLIADCKWFHFSSNSYSAGFTIIKSPGKKDFEKYVDYLSWRQTA